MPAVADASTLFNAGSEALTRGDLGGAVLLFRAAERLDPRADDLRANRSIAEARVALARGDAAATATARRAPGTLSSAEAWWLAAILLAVGACGMAWRLRSLAARRARSAPPGPGSNLARRLLDAAGIAGLALALWLAAGAIVEGVMPEAVVIERSLPLTAASGQPLPEAPALVAGETVRLGREREGLVEIRLGGSVVGWARRSGVWRVRDAAGYTPRSAADRGRIGEGANE